MPRFEHRRARRQLSQKLVAKGMRPMEALRAARSVDDHEIEMLAAETLRENDKQSLELGKGFGEAILQKLLDRFMNSGMIDKLFDKLVDKVFKLIEDKIGL